MKILDLGCGNDKYKSNNAEDVVIGLDKENFPEVDVVHDLEEMPLLFKDNEFDEIITSHVLEHISNLEPLLREMHRITKNKGLIKISVPFFTSDAAFSMIDHRRFFTYTTFDKYTEESRMHPHADCTFRITNKKIVFGRGNIGILNWFMNPIVNLMPKIYQRFFAWIVPSDELQFELEVVK